MTTTQDRWNAAIKTARKSGTRVMQNLSGCCRSCISADYETKLRVKDADTDVLAWSYGGQGSRYGWSDGEMFNIAQANRRTYRYDPNTGRETEVYFNHSNGAGNILAAAFREHGFDVEYEHDSESQCVVVKLPTPEVTA